MKTRKPTTSERIGLRFLRRRETENCSADYTTLRRALNLTPRGGALVIRRMEAENWLVRDHNQMRLTLKGSVALGEPL